MYACICHGLTYADVEQGARRADFRPDALVRDLQLDDESCCGRCANEVDQMLARCPARSAEWEATAYHEHGGRVPWKRKPASSIV